MQALYGGIDLLVAGLYRGLFGIASSGLTLFQIGLGTPASNNFVCWIFFLVGQKEKIENLHSSLRKIK